MLVAVENFDRSLIRFGFLEPGYLLAVGLLLLGLFGSIGGDFGIRAPQVLVVLIGALHLAVGLATLRLAVIGLSRFPAIARWPDLALLAIAGSLTSLVLAPFSFAIDQWLTIRGFETEDRLLRQPAQWFGGVFEEWTHVAGPALLVSMLLGLPAWWKRWPAAPGGAASLDAGSAGRAITTAAAAAGSATSRLAAPAVPPLASSPDNRPSCLQRLPAALGVDLVAARSELQYVRVYTTRGDALVLGALKDIVEHQEDGGVLAHRTWWVAQRHVRSLRRRGSRYVLTLGNGLEVPVSRRRQAALLERFGDSARLHDAPT